LQEAEFLRSIQDYPNAKACPIGTGFRILGKRWTIEVVRELLLGHNRFKQLEASVEGINPRMLSLRLKELEEHMLVSRRVFTSTPVQIEYALTDRGRNLVPVMFAMAEFSMKNFPEEVFEDGESRSPEQVAHEIEGLRNPNHSSRKARAG